MNRLRAWWMNHRASPRVLVWGALAAVLLCALAWPYLYLVPYLRLPLAFAIGLAGFLPRRRVSDALWLALPVLAAQVVDYDAGPQALACLVLPLYVLTWRPRFASLTGAALLALVLVASEFKMRFAGTRLTWHDIRFFFAQFGDNVGVMASQPTLLMEASGVLLLLGGIALTGWLLDRRGGAIALRWPLAASLVLALGVMATSTQQLVHEARKQREQGAWAVGQTIAGTARPVSRFLATAAMEPQWQPPGVDTATFRHASGSLVAAPGAAGIRADLVLFLQESQFNPATWADCPPSLCDLPVFGAGTGTAAYGPLRVHVFGGGTWLTEFALSEGVPHTAFGPGGDFAPFNVAPGTRRSFVRSLKAAGYRTVAVYPVGGGMMNARQAYEGYGFDAFYDAADLGLPGDFHTPDALVHEAAMRVLRRERQHGKPVLLLAVTIANHAEHGVQMERVPADLVKLARTAFPDGREAENVADYVWRTRAFERALDATRKEVLGGSRPAVLAWFGDHQPPFGTATALRDRIRQAAAPGNRIPSRYQTWYQVSTNLPRAGAPRQPQPLDIVFLPGLLAQTAGVPLDDWLAANVAAREQCGGLLMECLDPRVRDAYLAYLWRDLKAIELP